MKGGGNRWTDFVRDFAKMNNTTYMCALSNPECKQEYRAKFGNPKKLSKKAEQQTMAENDPLEIKKKQEAKKKLIKKKVVSLAKKRDEVIQKAEMEKMAAEDIPAPAPTPVVQAPSPAAKKRGRPAKYTNAEDARQAKIKNTIEASKRRQAEKRQAKADAKREKQENITMKIEDIKPKRGRPKKTGGAVATPPPPPTNVPIYQPPNSMIRQAFDRNGRANLDRYRVGGRSRVLMCGGMEPAEMDMTSHLVNEINNYRGILHHLKNMLQLRN